MIASSEWTGVVILRDAGGDGQTEMFAFVAVIADGTVQRLTVVAAGSETMSASDRQPLGHFSTMYHAARIETGVGLGEQAVLQSEVDVGCVPTVRRDVVVLPEQIVGERRRHLPNPVVVEVDEFVLVESGDDHLESFGSGE